MSGPRNGEATSTGSAPDRMQSFLAALRHTPIPTAPPPHDAFQAALGLNLLALALRRDHVERLSEKLALADSTHMTRSVTVDVNLAALTDEQRRALRSDAIGSTRPPTTIWLPIARQARTDLAPVVVRDSVGKVMPRLTQVQAARAIKQGMRKAFRMLLDSAPRTRLIEHVRADLNRSRWLIEATIANMIDNGGLRSGPELAGSVEHHADGDTILSRSKQRLAEPDTIRALAECTARELFAQDSSLLHLLAMASTEYLLVVEVPTDHPQVFLAFDAPVIPARSNDRLARWLTFHHEFTVSYRTVIPRAVDSYHVTVEVPPEINISRFFLTSDVDLPARRALVEDMRAVARRYDRLLAVSPKLLELELQSIGSRLAEFGRRRFRDLETFKVYIGQCYATTSRRSPRFPAPATTPAGLDLDRRVVTGLARFAERYETGYFSKLEPSMPAAVLEHLADQVEAAELEKDIYVDNDPRENAGHTRWQRRPYGGDTQPVEPVSATVYIALADNRPSLATNVSTLLMAVLLLVLGVGLVLWQLNPQDGRQPFPAADAIVTTLLLVPGLMLSRLDIPSYRAVLGRLRLLPRYIAYGSVVVAGALALWVATMRAANLAPAFGIALVILLLALLVMAADGIAKRVRRFGRVPVRTVSPGWLIDEVTERRPRKLRQCAVEFSTMGHDDA
ncbi:hypothetical protein [Labedaea rhizosphaerae]|uniref:hypothetical protein n=1 Tax=Labedaea rhizosphaerae TaxID=598644 RepID=UPI00105EE051|nr:hypothetical protein [Labedaea rhizosphaerae]